MEQPTITVTVSETFSLPGYEATKPSIALTDMLRPGETFQEAHDRLYPIARGLLFKTALKSVLDHSEVKSSGLVNFLKEEVSRLEEIEEVADEMAFRQNFMS